MISEAIRNVHASVLLSTPGGPPQAIMITSPNQGEGKTVLSINLGISLAMQGRSVAIIDMDLRKPSLHSVFEKSSQPGLSNFLTGNTSKEEIIAPTDIPNLTIIPAGTIPPNPTDLLASSRLQEFLEELRGRFQHLVIDTPPLLGFADARIISPLVDGVMLVIKHHSTPRETGRLARHLLLQMNTRVIGAVLNQVSTDRLGYGSYYYKYYTKQYNKYDNITH
jgi:capsular exopolysaccharide synthesis family protein